VHRKRLDLLGVNGSALAEGHPNQANDYVCGHHRPAVGRAGTILSPVLRQASFAVLLIVTGAVSIAALLAFPRAN